MAEGLSELDLSTKRMSSTRLIEKELQRFLTSAEPEVICIKGAWGVGKSYAWNCAIEKAKAEGSVALKRYAYVSLFGVNTLEQFKNSIFENTVHGKNIGTEPDLKTLKSNITSVATAAGKTFAPKIVAAIPGASNAVSAWQAISFLSVTKQIICIDDIERKGAGLRTLDVLGMVSMLREHRNCKVVLILNDDKLGNEKNDLLQYQEKVIDASLLFAPTAEECADIAVNKETFAAPLLREKCILLGISNIRIIKKIERLVLRVEPLLSKFSTSVFNQAVHSLVLLGWVHFSRPDEADSDMLEFIVKKRGHGLYGMSGDEEKLSDKEQEWDSLLDIYGYSSTDKFDMLLLDGVRAGFFDDARLVEQATLLDEQSKKGGAERSLQQAWRLYHDSFRLNQDEVLDGLVQALEENILHVNPGYMSSVVQVLKQLGQHERAKYVLDFFMENRNESADFYDLDDFMTPTDIADPDIRSAFLERKTQLEVKRAPVDILRSVGIHHSWSENDVAILAALSENDFYELFKEIDGIELRAVVNAALGFAKIATSDTHYASISAKARTALQRIGGESDLNKLRVKKFGIEMS